MTNPAGQLRLFRSGRESGPRYGSLLLILVVTYLLSAFTVARLVSAVQVVLFLAVVLIALRNGRFHRKTVQIPRGGPATRLGRLRHPPARRPQRRRGRAGEPVDSPDPAAGGVPHRAAGDVQPQITGQSIYGVLSAYMIIGLIFSAVYVSDVEVQRPAVLRARRRPTPKTFQYFSFTTLTTLGYGDFTAAEDSGRAVAVLEAMAGQMFLATLVARLVAGFRWSDRAAARRSSRQAATDPGDQAEVTGPGPDSSLPAAGTATPSWPPGEGRRGRPGPAEPPGCGAGTRNRPPARRAKGDRGVRPGPLPPPHGAGLNQAALSTA